MRSNRGGTRRQQQKQQQRQQQREHQQRLQQEENAEQQQQRLQQDDEDHPPRPEDPLLGNLPSTEPTTTTATTTPTDDVPLPTETAPLMDASSLPPSSSSGGHRKTKSVDFFGLGAVPSNSNAPPGSRHHLPRFGGLGHRKQAHSIGGGLSDSMRHLMSSLGPIREDMTETVHQVQQAFVSEIDKMDHNEHGGYLDFSMTRSLSIIPADLSDLAEETGLLSLSFMSMEDVTTSSHHRRRSSSSGPRQDDELDDDDVFHDEEQVALTTTTTTHDDDSTIPGPFWQYFGLIIAVLAVSSNATALHMLVGVPSPMKLYWRMTTSWCVLLFFAIRSLLRRGGIPSLSMGMWFTFLAAVICYSIHALLFIMSLEYTSIGNALIFANSQALLLIIAKACFGERIHILEGIGVLIAFSGAILCSTEETTSGSGGSSSSSSGNSADAVAVTAIATEGNDIHNGTSNAIIGDLMALGSAVFGVGYLTFAKAVRSQLPVTVFLFSVMLVGSILVLSYMLITMNGIISFTLDPDTGVFGWLSPERLPILLFLAIIVNCVGTMGFVRAMAYLDNIIISTATLCEPLLASMIAYIFHVGLLPGPVGWIGNLLVVCGTLAVVYPSMGKGGGMH